MPISEKQQKILAFPYTTKYQALICDGAVRSGKSSLMCIAFVDWAMREFNNTNFAICGKTVGSAIKNIITPYMALTYHRDKYKINFTRSDNKMVVRAGSRVNTFYVYGGKDESSYMLIQGITLGGVLLDEVALMTQSFVEEALARCLTFPNRRYWFNCNPDTPMHWFYQEWILQPEKHKALHLHFLMTDNPALDAETIRQAEQDFSGVFYDRKVLGLWRLAEGLVYGDVFDEKAHVVPTIERDYTKFYVSCDYGAQHATVFQLWGLCSGIWYLIKEYYHKGSEGKQKTVDEYYAELLKLTQGYKITQFFRDQAPVAASFNIYLRRKGDFASRDCNNEVLAGIQDVSTALKRGVMKINDCNVNTIREFGLYSWNPASPTDEPIKENDDCLCALRYFCLTAKIVKPAPVIYA